MTTTYNQFTKQTASKKIILVHLDMKREVKVFTTSGTSHTRTEEFYVIDVSVNGSTGTFTFTPSTKLLNITFDGDLVAQEVIVTYRLFLSDFDVITTDDLTLTGNDVKYQGLVKRVPGFSTQLNFASSNKTVVGSGNLELDNSTGFFNVLLNTYRFENKDFSAYSWSPDIPINEHKIIYRGTTARASISGDNLRFSLKDSIFNLNNEFSLTQFTSSEVIERHESRFKKSIYGRVNGMAIQSISQNGDGYSLTGTLLGEQDSAIISGVGTMFLSELAPRDKIVIGELSVTVRTVINNNSVIINSALTAGLTTSNALVLPSKQWYNRNRTYSVASHALKKFSTAIEQFVDFRRIGVASADGFAAGDDVIILGESYLIDKISKVYTDATNTTTRDVIVLARTLSSNNQPSIGSLIETSEVGTARIEDVLLLDADLTVNNADNTETTLIISNDAEQNVAPEGVFGNDLTAVSDSNFIILGTPTVQTINISNVASQNYRGTHFQLSEDDDTTATGSFVWFGPVLESIPEFTTTAAALVNFEQGDIYLDTTLEKYFGARGNGVGSLATLIDLGSDEPIRAQIEDADIANSEIVATLVQVAMASAKPIWLFAPTTTVTTGDIQWKLITNQGISVVTNTVSGPAANSPTFNTNILQTGAVPSLDLSLSENLSPRDLIKVGTQPGFFQVIQAESKFAQVVELINLDVTGIGTFKNPAYATDTSLVTVSAFGQTREGTINGTFIKTPSDIARIALDDNGLTQFIDASTFTDASINENLQAGIYIPYAIGDDPPTILDLINKVTLTGLGSVGLTNDFLLKYQLLNGFKQPDLNTIRVVRNNEVTNRAEENLLPSPLFRYTIRNIEANYDFGEAEPNTKLIRIENARIGRLTDLNTTEKVDLYTPSLISGTNIADRFLNYAQSFNRTVSFRGSLSLSDINIGDIILLDLLELRNLQDNNIPFIGMVTNFERDGKIVGMIVEDFGGLFVRAAGLTTNTLGSFSSSNERQRLLGTFLTDNNGLINNQEETLGTNILV